MIDKELILTAEGLKRLEEELNYLKSVKRREIAQRIKEAREFGDLNENAEYDHAKNEQAFVEGRILALERTLRNARLVEKEEVDPERVNVGCRVTLRDLARGEEFAYTIVGSAEADPAENRISHLSPVAQAILGQRVGSVVEVNVPAGLVRYEILAIDH